MIKWQIKSCLRPCYSIAYSQHLMATVEYGQVSFVALGNDSVRMDCCSDLSSRNCCYSDYYLRQPVDPSRGPHS